MKQKLFAALAVGACLLSGVSHAQAQTPSILRGTIQSVQAHSLTVTTRDGKAVPVDVTTSTLVAEVTHAKIADIKPGSFIGTAAVPQANGTLRALEVHVFAPSLRGTGEGSRPWETPGKKSTMTNGTVGDLVGTKGRTLTVNYNGGEKNIIVPDDVPIVAVDKGSKSMLTAGSHVVVLGGKGADGNLAAARILVGLNGVVPPM